MRKGIHLLMLMLAVLAGSALAADKSITLDTGDVFTLSWSDGWVVGTNPPSSQPGTLTVTGPDARLWRLVVTPLPPNPTLTADPGNLRMYMRMWVRGMENGGVQVAPEQMDIRGGGLSGVYVKAHDARRKTKAEIQKAGGDFTDAYVGALSIGGRPYLFEVSWIAGGEAAAKLAMVAIKTLRVR